MSLLRLSMLVAASGVASMVAVEGAQYGVDCSFPIHHNHFACNTTVLGTEPAQRYEEFMQGCREKWGPKGAKRCDSNEIDRIEVRLPSPTT